MEQETTDSSRRNRNGLDPAPLCGRGGEAGVGLSAQAGPKPADCLCGLGRAGGGWERVVLLYKRARATAFCGGRKRYSHGTKAQGQDPAGPGLGERPSSARPAESACPRPPRPRPGEGPRFPQPIGDGLAQGLFRPRPPASPGGVGREGRLLGPACGGSVLILVATTCTSP